MSIDLDKPISSKLDLDSGFSSPEPVSADDFPISDITSADVTPNPQNLSVQEQLSDDGEIYPQVRPTAPVNGTNVRSKPKALGQIPNPSEHKINLGKRKKATQMPAVRADDSKHPVVPWENGKNVENESAQTLNPTEHKINLGKRKKGTQMPAVRSDASNPPVVPWGNGKNGKNEAAQTLNPTEHKINLGKRKKATQMPGIRADASNPPVVPWKNEEHGDNEAQRDLNAGLPPQNRRLGSGTVNFAFSDRKNIILLAISLLVILCLVALIPVRIFGELDFESGSALFTFGAMMFIMAASVIISGEKWHYEATGREIIFSRKGRPSRIIFYKDVLAVDYAPYKFLGIIEMGYLVTVLAYGERHEFRYVFPNLGRKLPFDYTPFEIIRNQIDQLGLNNPVI